MVTGDCAPDYNSSDLNVKDMVSLFLSLSLLLSSQMYNKIISCLSQSLAAEWSVVPGAMEEVHVRMRSHVQLQVEPASRPVEKFVSSTTRSPPSHNTRTHLHLAPVTSHRFLPLPSPSPLSPQWRQWRHWWTPLPRPTKNMASFDYVILWVAYVLGLCWHPRFSQTSFTAPV